MRRSAFALALVALAFPLPSLAQSHDQRAVDLTASKVQFSIQHIFVQHVIGTVPILSGSVILSGDAAIPSSVQAVLDATKVSTDDPDQTSCIRSADYFDVKQFPSWTFTSTKITPHGAAAFGMDGTLTIHGVAQPEHLDVTIGGDASHPTYHAVGEIDRHAFGMKGTRLDPVIGGTADVTLDITLK
jgi:polyisoprenoid-binding protein YceI